MQTFKTRRRPTLPRDVVPSALTGLTTLFGMVRGEPRRYNHLKLSYELITYFNKLTYWVIIKRLQAQTRLDHYKYKSVPPALRKCGKTYISLRVISTTRL